MTDHPTPGDKVAWQTSQGETTWKVVKKQTAGPPSKAHGRRSIARSPVL